MAYEDSDPISYAARPSGGEDGADANDGSEVACCKQWHKKLKEAREFDKEAHRGYASDRKWLSGSKPKHRVFVPIAQTYVEILESHLYARNPTVEVDPTAMTEPPPQKEILAKAIHQVLAKRQQQFAGAQQYAQLGKTMASNLPPQALGQLAMKGHQMLQQGGAGQTGVPAPPPPGAGDMTQMQPPQNIPDNDPEVQQLVEQVMSPYREQRDDANQFANTLEILVQKTWDTADLKTRGKELVNSALSIGIGWMKAAWYERKGKDPATQSQINDLLEQAAMLQANRQQINDGDATGDELDARKAELDQQIAGLQAKDEITLERGFLLEIIPAQAMQVSTEVSSIAQYKDAEWICHYTYPTLERAKADYPNISAKLDKACKYYPVKPKPRRIDRNGLVEAQFPEETETKAHDADFYRSSDAPGVQNTQNSEPCVQVKEIWDRVSGNVITLIDGLNMYAKDPYVPEIRSTRGIPFFQYAIGRVNGERHPVSLISRTDTLLDEYNQTRTNYRTVRKRAIPKTAYNRALLPPEEASKLARADTGEMVGLDITNPEAPMNTVLTPIAYNGVDAALYDTTVIRAELEQIWGIAEALSGASVIQQTATESELQNNGTQMRGGKRTDDLDDVFSDLACYTGEQLLQALKLDDAIEMAGPWALWPEGLSIQDMQVMTSVRVSAGSSGRPATAMQQQAWAQIAPQLQAMIQQIGALRGSSPDEIADCMEQLVIETTRRTGDRIDPTRFLPDPPRQPPMPKPVKQQPLKESAYDGTQIQALIQAIIDMRAKGFSAGTCEAIISASFPKIPPPLVHQMVQGALPQPGDPDTEIKSKNIQTRSPESKNPSEANPNPPPIQPGPGGASPTINAPGLPG